LLNLHSALTNHVTLLKLCYSGEYWWKHGPYRGSFINTIKHLFSLSFISIMCSYAHLYHPLMSYSCLFLTLSHHLKCTLSQTHSFTRISTIKDRALVAAVILNNYSNYCILWYSKLLDAKLCLVWLFILASIPAFLNCNPHGWWRLWLTHAVTTWPEICITWACEEDGVVDTGIKTGFQQLFLLTSATALSFLRDSDPGSLHVSIVLLGRSQPFFPVSLVGSVLSWDSPENEFNSLAVLMTFETWLWQPFNTARSS